MKTDSANKLPIVALICIAVLLLSGWLFFLATDELATVNFQRKQNQRLNTNAIGGLKPDTNQLH